jgi:DNA-binding PadR family transcriptional regulator
MWSRHEFGFERGRERFFEKGDLKYVILELLREKPRHGYEVIRSLEERMGGFYAPSPGAVYPTLQMLEDMGYVRSADQDGKRIYQITEEGQKFLGDRRPQVDQIFERMRARWDPAWTRDLHRVMHDLRDDLRDFGRTVAGEARLRWPDPDQTRRIREVIARARTEVEAILAENRTRV